MPKVNWWWSQAGPGTKYQPWDEGQDLDLSPGSAVWVRVAAKNDGETTDGHANFVVPVQVEVARYDQDTRVYTSPREGAENETAGFPPDHEVRFFSVERNWLAEQVWMGIYLVVVPENVAGTVTLLYDLGVVESARRLTVA